MVDREVYDVIIIGSGPAGYTASIYACRANLKTLVIAGVESGGQLMLTREVENFPGFPEGVLGPDLMERMRQQAESQGAEIIYDDATAVDFKTYPYKVFTGDAEYLGRTVIIATGASPKWLGLESERRLLGRGVSSCATCDGPLFKGAENIVVVGGGDSAMEYALYLANLAEKVTVIHRRDKLRASKILQERAFANSKITFVWDSVVTDILGEKKVEAVKVKNVKTGGEQVIKCNAVFIAIGHKPNTEIFKGQVELDEMGYVRLYNGMQTNVPGVFAAGDVHDHRYRQAVTAAGYGCMAAMEAVKFIEEGYAEKLLSKPIEG
ncbi:MAG TPA: thioredoxin-disulfide reductase [Candidatus Caldiarchaeum subterraneum]|uniref:Thioredoxin-disulfide reductase n=1 Tax=Caldiarchaeum subterraneum TaxID=311458 RepID=A0A832ZYE9_CALS0|nr:thioredoxin-disulfide reductase [Aigarchaeota archaeon]HIQ29641.1 thioredoxin-disulfide reductase [Candidatus Caldarchaeum subterraneum]